VTPRCDRRDRGQIALRLWDDKVRRSLVVASVRWTHTTAEACLPKNLRTLDRKLEQRWPRRRLTIVAGDFNSAPDKRVGANGADLISAGRERNPECWYRAFTPPRGDNDEGSSTRASLKRDCRRVRGPNSYFDTVRLAAHRRGSAAICRQWTYTRAQRATNGTACSDTNKDGLRDRSRIDYIWARWENRRGRPMTLSTKESGRRVVAARADATCSDRDCERRRYSDHRAAYATVRYGRDR
jgi:hypothetical protein